MRFLALIFVLQLFISCNKSDSGGPKGPPPCEGTPQTFYITDAGLIQAKFKTGTYWVYYDSITSTFDSNAVITHTSSIGHSEYQCDNYEGFTFTLYKYGSSPGNNELYSIGPDGIGQNPSDWSLSPKIYFQIGKQDNSSNAHFRIDSMFIYDRYYKNIMQTIFNSDRIETGYKAIYYFNTEFGFLRKDLYNSSNQLVKKRLLIRKNIIR